ncbi:MAG: hypothetical protein JWQ09_4806 [Segetibacter sp.]|nr:hypothetical protein [Segetibacter sp.]
MKIYSSIQKQGKQSAPDNSFKQGKQPSFFQPFVGDNRFRQDQVSKDYGNSERPFFLPSLSHIQSKVKATGQTNVQRKPGREIIQKQDAKDEPKPEDKKPEEKKGEEAKTGFIDTASLIKTFDDLIGKLPARYKEAYEKYKSTHETYIFDLSESRKLASNEIMAFWNLSNALVYKATSPYKNLGFGDSIKMAESLSGASDTYINLASSVLHKDLKKYLSDEFPDTVTKNLGFLILAGILLQSGISGIGYALNKEIDFTTIISPVLSGFTEPPAGLNNPFILDNIPDPRWKSPFLQPSPGLDVNTSKFNPDAPTPSLNINLGLNFASLKSLYPKNDEEKKKYKGLELYPFFNYSHAYQKEGQPEPDKTDKFFTGIFIGNKGIYTLMEGGLITGPTGVVEAYGRAGLILKNLDKLRLWKLDAEADYRQATGDVRTRIDSAAEIEFVDNSKWQFIVGGTVGGLIPGQSTPGKFDYGANAKLYYKEYSPDKKDEYKTGAEVGFTSRLQDPFDATSQQLLTVKTGLVFKGMLKLGVQYDKISGGGPINTFPVLPAGTNLPGNNVTVFAGFDFAPLLFRNEKK